jgi:hydroxymethylglutaryl-CoA reductase
MMTATPHVVRSAAPGKVILLGEHAVVYGRAALAASIDRYVEVTVTPAGGSACPAAVAVGAVGATGPVPIQAVRRAAELTGVNPAELETAVSTNLPVGVGLGSSAALSVALVRALAEFAGQALADSAVCARAFELEKLFHGFPSGIDNTVVTYCRLIAFRRGSAVRPLVAARPVPLVVALGGAPRETQKTVRGLRQRWEISPELYEPLFDEIDCLVSAAESAIGTGDLQRLGALMNANHALLQRLGVSTGELDEMVALARASGALGAKLTGGGGGGAVICLCDGDRERLVEAFTRAGWHAFSTDIARQDRGVDAADDAGRFDQRNGARA